MRRIRLVDQFRVLFVIARYVGISEPMEKIKCDLSQWKIDIIQDQ
jgi:hypothetical protein